MGHLNINKEDVYEALAKNLDNNPPGVPYNETLIQILKILYTQEEAELASKFPGFISSFSQIKKKISLDEDKLKQLLDDMSSKGLVIDMSSKGKEDKYYMLTPMVVGFFEYTFMRVSSDLPLKELAELFEEYFKDTDAIKGIFGSDTKLFRASTYESKLPANIETEVLDFEKASDLIKDTGRGAITTCSCRHKAWHLGKHCDAPLDVCTSLGSAADWIIEKGFGRPASTDELLRILEKTEEKGLVHLLDNVQQTPFYLCHCCGCCCGVLRAINEHEVPSVQPSNFIPSIIHDNCNGCGRCANRCHINAIEIIEEIPGNKRSQKAKLKEEWCFGCGACIDGCKNNAIILEIRQNINKPPLNKKEQTMRIAKERGKRI